MIIWQLLVATFIALIAGGSAALLVHYVIWKDDERELVTLRGETVLFDSINVSDAYNGDVKCPICGDTH